MSTWNKEKVLNTDYHFFFFKENFECSSYIVVNLLKLVASPKLTLNSCELANSLFIWKILGSQKITQICNTIHHMTNYDWWRCVSTWPTYTCHNSPCDELWHKIVPFFFGRSTIRFIFTLITVLSPHCLSLSRATFLYDKEGEYFTAVSLSLSLLRSSYLFCRGFFYTGNQVACVHLWLQLFLARQPVATQFCLGCSYFTLKKFRVI